MDLISGGENMKDIVIIGAGGVGAEAAWIIEQINNQKREWNLLGYIDDSKNIGTKILSYEVLGKIEDLVERYEGKNIDENPYIIIAITDYESKKRIAKYLSEKFRFAKIIHPSVYIHESNSIGEGSIVYPGVILTVNINIGKHVIISPKCGIGHNSRINDYVSLLWNVNVSGYDNIKEGSLIGSGSTIIQNKTIGTKSVIGAGAVVINDIGSGRVAVGIPAEVKKNE